MEDIKKLVKRVLTEVSGKEYSYSEHYFEFKLNTSIPFGRGRYSGSSLGNFTDAGWYWSADDDTDMGVYFYHMSHYNGDTTKFRKFIEENNLFPIIKKDLLRCNVFYVVQAVCGWRDLDKFYDLISYRIEDAVYSKMITKKEAEAIYDEIGDFEEFYNKIVEEHKDILKRTILSEIQKMRSAKDLFDFKPDIAVFDNLDRFISEEFGI